MLALPITQTSSTPLMLAPFRLAPVSLDLLRSHFGQSLSPITLSRSCDGKAVRFRGEDWAEAQANAIAEYKENNGYVDVSVAKVVRLGFI
jgi:hypothetical protein